MTTIAKATWLTSDNHVNVSMPIAKIDEARRTVSGWATLDNVDTQDDVVTAEASKRAFDRARGNLREMHQPIAVGKIVDFKEEEYFDTETGEFYRGIFVQARVSEGAESTWIKVLDGTLTGFSIGGEIIDASTEFIKEANKTIRFVKDYDLTELSLVDNPANQMANVFSIQKVATGSVIKGMVAETVVENVFVCQHDDLHVSNEPVFKTESTELAECPSCGTSMQNIGWFESTENRAEKVSGIVEKFLNPDNEDEGGETMGTKEKEETLEKNSEEVVETEAVEEPVEEETSEEVVEVTDDEEEIAKRFNELHEAVENSLNKTREETSEQIANLQEKIDEVGTTFVKKASELEEKLNKFGENLEATKSRLTGFEKALSDYNSEAAVRKSSDLEEEDKIVRKDTHNVAWDGAFSLSKNL